jgi:hypothetical protein
MVARMVALCWLVPALAINVDWTGETHWAWNLAAGGSILGSALFIEAALLARSWLMTPVFLLAGVFLFVCNVQVAFDNASHKSDHRSDHRRSAMVAAKNQSSQRSQWSQGRAEAATVAGERASKAYEADIQAKIAADSKRWQSTGQCDPLQITAGPSREFCSAIAELRSKLEAAKQRETFDADIKKLDETTGSTEVVTSVDPFADNIADFLAMFGVKLTDDTKHALAAQKDVTRSLSLELLAMFGPSAWLLLITALTAPRAPVPYAPAPVATRPAAVRPVAAAKPVADTEPPPVALDDAFHAFVAEVLEESTGTMLPASEPFRLWMTWCAKHGKEPGTQKVFGGKMKSRFAWEPNNNRPRYLNVRAKVPALRLVSTA